MAEPIVYAIVQAHPDHTNPHANNDFVFRLFGGGADPSKLHRARGNSRGNPYGYYGDAYEADTGRSKYSVTIKVAHVTSGSLWDELEGE